MKSLMMVGGAIALIVCAGCITRNHEAVESCSVNVAPVEAPKPQPVDVEVSHPGPFVVKVAGTGPLAQPLQLGLSNTLVRRKFLVGGAAEPDATVTLATTWREKERLADWAVWEGSATLNVAHDALGGALLGTKTFTALSGRVADEAAAKTQVATALGKDVDGWVGTVLKPTLSKRKVTVQHPAPVVK